MSPPLAHSQAGSLQCAEVHGSTDGLLRMRLTSQSTRRLLAAALISRFLRPCALQDRKVQTDVGCQAVLAERRCAHRERAFRRPPLSVPAAAGRLRRSWTTNADVARDGGAAL